MIKQTDFLNELGLQNKEQERWIQTDFFYKFWLHGWPVKKKDPDPFSWFGEWDVMSCPKCYESKLLGNKYYNQLDNALDRYNQTAFDMLSGDEISWKKMEGLEKKINKIQTEFINVLRGRTRCCYPIQMLEDYLKAWNIK